MVWVVAVNTLSSNCPFTSPLTKLDPVSTLLVHSIHKYVHAFVVLFVDTFVLWPLCVCVCLYFCLYRPVNTGIGIRYVGMFCDFVLMCVCVRACVCVCVCVLGGVCVCVCVCVCETFGERGSEIK